MTENSGIAAPYTATNKYRAARFRQFRDLVDATLLRHGRCRIVDVGGLEGYWRSFGPDLVTDPRVSITLVNVRYVDAVTADPAENFDRRVGDARALTGFHANEFDVVHSNSVIEHVGRWQDQVAMANEVRRIAPRHFVQTPYYGFPLEPHCRTPFFHWLPEQARYRLVMRRKLGFWSKASTVGDAMMTMQSVALLDRRQFSALFPDSDIVAERVFGLTKSLIAIGNGTTARS